MLILLLVSFYIFSGRLKSNIFAFQAILMRLEPRDREGGNPPVWANYQECLNASGEENVCYFFN